MKKKVFFIFLVMVLAVGLLAGCRPATQPTETPKEEKVLIVALDGAILTLDPAMHRDRRTETVVRNMFDGLVTRTTDMEVVPELAESWDIVSPTEYVFNLRRGVTFHNGDPFNADDVVFTFERILTEGAISGQSSPRKGLLGPLAKVEKIDDYKVKFTLNNPWPVFLKMLPHQQIVPKKYIEQNGDAYFAENPIGTGPFKFQGGNINEQVIMERFDNYYGGSHLIPPVGPARVDRAIFRIVPESATRVALLRAGDVHIIQNVPAHMVPQLKGDSGVSVKTTTGTTLFYGSLNTKMKPFNDIRVRQAIALAVDYEGIVKGIYGDYAVYKAGPIIKGAFGKNTTLQPYGFNQEKARELLKEAGFEKGLALVIDCEDGMKDEAEAIAAQLRQVGIEATVRTWEWGVLRPLLVEGSRGMLLSDFGNASMDPFDLLNPVFMTGGRANYTHYSNPVLDQLLQDAAVEMDAAKREAMYKQAEQVIHEEYLWVFNYNRLVIEASSAKVENWKPSPDGRINLHDVGLKD
jgi:peptide/nickel transport system substrate-binding protein